MKYTPKTRKKEKNYTSSLPQVPNNIMCTKGYANYPKGTRAKN